MTIVYSSFKDESQLPASSHKAHFSKELCKLIERDLSEPYSIFTYRYFIHGWPSLCLLAYDQDKMVGTIVCKLDKHRDKLNRGYIAMLAVHQNYRHQGIGSELVKRAGELMKEQKAQEIVLETELCNVGALALYERLGFIRDKYLKSYYLNGMDAYRLKLIL